MTRHERLPRQASAARAVVLRPRERVGCPTVAHNPVSLSLACRRLQARMLHRTHIQEALLAEGASSSDAMDALLHDLGQSRARRRPRGRPFVTLAYAQSVDGSI